MGHRKEYLLRWTIPMNVIELNISICYKRLSSAGYGQVESATARSLFARMQLMVALGLVQRTSYRAPYNFEMTERGQKYLLQETLAV
jgi:hypothetical protein